MIRWLVSVGFIAAVAAGAVASAGAVAAPAEAVAPAAPAPLPAEPPPTIAADVTARVKAFRTLCAEAAAAAAKTSTLAVPGTDGWLFLAAELRHLGAGKFWGEDAAKVSKAAKPEWADPVPAIVDFKTQLEKAGIELLVVPVPPKPVIYPDKLPGAAAEAAGAAPPRLDAADEEFYGVLRAAGIKVIDLAPEFLAHRADPRGEVYCRTDSHWSGTGCVQAAARIMAEIKDRAWLKAVTRLPLESDWRRVEIAGDLGRSLGGETPPVENVELRFVGRKTDAGLVPLEDDAASPVILLGDSHTLVFHAGADLHAKGAGLADQLALELGMPLDVLGVRGSGVTAPRVNLYQRGLSNPNYLAGKRLVIWCFSAREFTEGQGWRKLPLTKEAAATPTP